MLLIFIVTAAACFFWLLVSRRMTRVELKARYREIDSIREGLLAKSESLDREREEISTTLSAISDAILAVDLEGAPLFFNHRFVFLSGMEERLKHRDIRVWEIFRNPEIQGAFRAALSEKRRAEIGAAPIESGAGTQCYYSLSVSPLNRRSGEAYGAIGIFHDVTELKHAERIRIDFVANVSHELRTPLTAIKGYADTLLHDAKAGRACEPEFLEVIGRNVNRLMSLINDLLDLSALESTDGFGEGLQKSRVSTGEITSRVAQELSREVKVKCDCEWVMADSKRLEQVLVNLLDNANKYTPPGSLIEVLWSQEGSETILRVRDQGPGIPLEHHARLFERFYRVDKARSREQGGTGLGLAIVKHIMQRHGGSVSIASAPGQGAIFTCRFPL